MKVAVGSLNPVKIECVKQAFEALWPAKQWQVEGVEVNSGVSDQPMSIPESIKGARQRARTAIKELDADYGVGLEGGLHKEDGTWFDYGWVVIVDKDGTEGSGSTIHMEVPPKVMKLIEDGLELGHANDEVFGRSNSKQAEGHFGLMTNNVITRTHGYRDAVVTALSRFTHSEVF